jgi:hypothetical protein
MGIEKYLIVYGSGTIGIDVVDHTTVTSPLDITLPIIDIAIKREMQTFPDIDFKLPREKPRRDWEQRQKTRRRK